MRRIVSFIKKYTNKFFTHLTKKSQPGNKSILDKITKGGYI
jgi:hypothetical protein